MMASKEFFVVGSEMVCLSMLAFNTSTDQDESGVGTFG